MKKTLTIFIGVLLFLLLLIFLILCLFPKKHLDIIQKYASQYNIESYVVASVINVESGYDENALSNANARGLMQLLPSTAEEIANKLKIDFQEDDLFDVDINIHFGCYYLSYLLDIFDNNLINALCAYNWGLNNVREWINDGNIDESNTITNIPVKETRDYIQKFKVNKYIYKNIYRLK